MIVPKVGDRLWIGTATEGEAVPSWWICPLTVKAVYEQTAGFEHSEGPATARFESLYRSREEAAAAVAERLRKSLAGIAARYERALTEVEHGRDNEAA